MLLHLACPFIAALLLQNENEKTVWLFVLFLFYFVQSLQNDMKSAIARMHWKQE